MLLAACLVLSFTVFPACLSFLYPAQRVQFVDTGESAQILCTTAEKIEDNGFTFSWYKRRESELPVLIKHCRDEKMGGRFACRAQAYSLQLEIVNAQKSDSGIYFCVTRNYQISNGSVTLIVGGSYTPSTWVMLSKPAEQGPSSRLENQLACVVHGVSNLVQVSWDVPGDLPHETWTLLAKNSSAALTIVSLLRFPMELQHSSGNKIVCKVRFNSSSTSMKRVAVYNNTSSSTDDHGNCEVYTVSLVVMGVLSSLLIFLSFLWVRIGFSSPGCHTEIYEPAPSEDMQDGICYAQLECQAKMERREDQGFKGRNPKF